MNYPMFNPYYQNPMYGMQQQLQQPQQQQFVQPVQQIPLQQNQNVLNGKIVENQEVFKGMDIPMDGNTYYFPKADGSEIYAKRWLPNGTTEQTVYKVYEESKEEATNPLMDKLNVIEGQLATLQEIVSKKTVNKKES